MTSKVYAVRRGKKVRVGHGQVESPRRYANRLTASGKSGWRHKSQAEVRAWKPKKGRRKLGARRKLTFIETIIKWVAVPIGTRRRTRRR
jgi:hypothetical protein